MRMLIKLFISFARIGAVTFGGGYSMFPLFQRDFVEKNGWLSETEFTDYLSVSQCIPGIISVNLALFIGHKQRGFLGGITAALGVMAPSILFILLIASFFTQFSEIPIVQNAFAGIRVCVCVLIINAVIKIWKNAIIDKLSLLIFAAVFAISVFTAFPVAILVAAAGIVGIALSALRRRAK